MFGQQRLVPAACAPTRPLLLVLVLLLAAFLVRSVVQPQRIRADEPLNAVYLADTARAPLDLAQARRAGVRVVSSVAALHIEAATADAVILDRGTLAMVDRDWLNGQLRQGKLIVGLDIPIEMLAEMAGYQKNYSGYLQDHGDHPFYAWFHERTERSGVRLSGSGSDRIYSPEGFLGLLRITAKSVRTEHNPPGSEQPGKPRATRPAR